MRALKDQYKLFRLFFFEIEKNAHVLTITRPFYIGLQLTITNQFVSDLFWKIMVVIYKLNPTCALLAQTKWYYLLSIHLLHLRIIRPAILFISNFQGLKKRGVTSLQNITSPDISRIIHSLPLLQL